MNKELIALLALNRVSGIGPAVFSSLIQCFGNASTVFQANRTQLSRIVGVSDDIVDRLSEGIDATHVEQDVLWLEESNSHRAIFLHSPDYPVQLARIHRPPPVLFLNGRPDLLHSPQISIVGSRNPTSGGLRNARAFAAELVRCGLTITSGLAAGIDGAAHQAALDVSKNEEKAKTIAVAATGLDRIYPAHHKELAYEIVEKGLMISEFPVGTGPLQGNFPRRNRIISGLSLGTLVVEAAKRSGSLISARCAMEQDREVFAIPGSIHSPQSRGCHWLIKQGAKLVETSDDIAEEILGLLPQTSAVESELSGLDKNENSKYKQEASALSEKEQQVLDAIGFDPVTLDVLLLQLGMNVDELNSIMGQLELQDRIEILPGGRFSSKL